LINYNIMNHAKAKQHVNRIESLSGMCIRLAGSNTALVLAFVLVLLWALAGPFCHFSEKWELMIGTASSIVTFLMVFLIQKSQNKNSLAIQLKLNELVAANETASNRLVNVEGMTEEELKVIQKYYYKLGDFAQKQDNLQQSHSIDEKHNDHTIKQEMEEELKNLTQPPDPGRSMQTGRP
jgi:low affinity Fe/Cu permease